MIAFLLNDANLVYAIVLAFVLALAVLEGAGVILGMSLLNLLDEISPFELDADAETDVSSSGLSQLIGWLCLDRLPLLVWLILFCTGFGVSGLSVNYLWLSYFDSPALLSISIAIALVGAIAITRALGGAIARIMPKSETASISTDEFSGHVAQITLGRASKGNPAEAVFSDIHHQKHYVLAEPEDPQDVFEQGTKILLLNKTATGWIASRYQD